ncbi:MBOAT, membrane-bound O-acyltransferase family-domain-containing protein, partial [Kickxella alabastrina]|uniref:MBOAT, membrane-bound O-acyltransferase family-domain-containing protein n=1 Tax=Kickxella alabastrina TaxID=61397 RepID=UPI002220ACA4
YLQAQVVHYKPRVSVLDKELTTVSYHGLINFLLLLLSATLIRLAIENYMKYGFLVSIPGTSVSRRDWLASVAGFLSVSVAFFVALAIEKNAVPSKPNYANVSDEALRVGMDADEKRTVLMHLSNLAFVLVAPSCITYFAIFQPALGTAVMMSACIMFLKLLAVGDGSKAGPAHGNARHRIHYLVAYPHNVSLRNFGYFWLAPTLCYQPSYPRISGSISKSFVAKRLSELVILCITMYVVIQQYAVPTLVGSVKAIDTRDGFWLSERVLKLSVISAIVWFLGFYALFHAGLNALAEVLRFADRAFYLDWWNSVDLAAYWREWNLPIHYFCKRHIMVPLVSAPLNLPVSAGVMVTFLFSAVMHELLFGIPTHCLKGTRLLA